MARFANLIEREDADSDGLGERKGLLATAMGAVRGANWTLKLGLGLAASLFELIGAKQWGDPVIAARGQVFFDGDRSE